MDWVGLTCFIYIVARMSGFILFNPILGRTNLNNMFKSGFILVLSVFMYGTVNQTVTTPDTTIEFILHILLELMLGFLLGMVVQFFFYIPQMAGFTIDTQLGLTMNQDYDPGSKANMSVNGTLLNVLMTLLFFAANGHHTLLRIILTSGDVVPLGAVTLTNEAFSALLEIFCQCSVLAVKLCLPILAAELVGQVGMGVLMKVIPQINVFVINIDLKVIIGLVLLLILISPFSEFLLQVESGMLDSLENILHMLT